MYIAVTCKMVIVSANLFFMFDFYVVIELHYILTRMHVPVHVDSLIP